MFISKKQKKLSVTIIVFILDSPNSAKQQRIPKKVNFYNFKVQILKGS